MQRQVQHPRQCHHHTTSSTSMNTISSSISSSRRRNGAVHAPNQCECRRPPLRDSRAPRRSLLCAGAISDDAAAAAAAAARSSSSSSSSGSSDQQPMMIRQARPQHYFPIAELHTTCFQSHRSPGDAMWKAFDRVWALQINDDLARRGAGRCVLLVAFDPTAAAPQLLDLPDVLTATAADAAAAAQAAADTPGSSPVHCSGSSSLSSLNSSSSSSSSRRSSSSSDTAFAGDLVLPDEFAFPRLGYWLSRLVDRTVWPGLGQHFEQMGIIGAAQVDTFGDIIPPRTLSAQRDGALGWVPRSGFAYISNVAVAPAARRRGVAGGLMRAAEGLAAAWGCSKAALHVNTTNTPAVELYRRLGYRKGVLEAPWMPYLQGRPPDRCLLMLKRLGSQQQQQQQPQLGVVAVPGGVEQQQQQDQERTAGAAMPLVV